MSEEKKCGPPAKHVAEVLTQLDVRLADMEDWLNTMSANDGFNLTLICRHKSIPRGHMILSRDSYAELRQTLKELEEDQRDGEGGVFGPGPIPHGDES